jgi:hypothetical protein
MYILIQILKEINIFYWASENTEFLLLLSLSFELSASHLLGRHFDYFSHFASPILNL